MKHFKKRFTVFANKSKENVSDSRNAKEHYQPFIRKKNEKAVKQVIRTNYLSNKTNQNFWKPKHIWYKTNHYRTSKHFP